MSGPPGPAVWEGLPGRHLERLPGRGSTSRGEGRAGAWVSRVRGCTWLCLLPWPRCLGAGGTGAPFGSHPVLLSTPGPPWGPRASLPCQSWGTRGWRGEECGGHWAGGQVSAWETLGGASPLQHSLATCPESHKPSASAHSLHPGAGRRRPRCAEATASVAPGRASLETILLTHSPEWCPKRAGPSGRSRLSRATASGAQLDRAGQSPAPGAQLSAMYLLLLQVKQALGLKGLFLRGPKPGSLDSHAAGRPPPRPSVSQRLLRRTASAPSKSQKPGCKAFPELVLGPQDLGSEGEASDAAPSSPGPTPEAPALEELGGRSPRGKAPVERSLVQVRPPRAPEGPGPARMATTCMKYVVGSCTGEDAEGLRRGQLPSPGPESRHAAISQQPRAWAGSLGAPHTASGRNRGAPKGPGSRQPGPGGCGFVSSDSSSPGSPEGTPCWPEGARRQVGALQREMNALFIQKLEEIRSKSPVLSTGKPRRSSAVSPWWLPRCPCMAWLASPLCFRAQNCGLRVFIGLRFLVPLAGPVGPSAPIPRLTMICPVGPQCSPGAGKVIAALAAAVLTPGWGLGSLSRVHLPRPAAQRVASGAQPDCQGPGAASRPSSCLPLAPGRHRTPLGSLAWVPGWGSESQRRGLCLQSVRGAA